MMIAIDATMAVLIWLVQIIIYPSFRTQQQDGFRKWHRGYTRQIGFIVGPLMLTQIAVHGMSVWVDPNPTGYVQVACIVVALVVTATRSVPCHRALSSRGKDADVIDRLVASNWLRTGAWTAVLVLSILSMQQA